MELSLVKQLTLGGAYQEICDEANQLASKGNYKDSLSLLSQALEYAPFSSMLRHIRGRKYIGALEFECSIADLTLASQMMEEDWEPRYYLAVSYYLSGQYEKARFYHLESMRMIENEGIEALPAVVDWIWMSSVKLGDKEGAAKILEKVDQDTPSEDGDYKARVLLYKGVYSPIDFVETHMDNSLETDRKNIYRLMLMYGLSNYYRYIERDENKANELCKEIVKSDSYHNLFAYIQAQHDLER